MMKISNIANCPIEMKSIDFDLVQNDSLQKLFLPIRLEKMMMNLVEFV
jgi:hypothetical protein